ncbi:molybdenum cofactor guanylyltransferase [Anaerobacillus alkalilacustris]|uniref:molybdenum cofactor guanylyltransferase n=1 Tax=Anaerobacillus alkalilacustris TaxID=393763 RepID=UPI001FE119D0|nr:molybdenum cofactor guanylyltransferase [Anaerobacillus alkalilacustris]
MCSLKAGAVILAGGKSSRMGKNKALLQINGITTIERTKNSLREVFDDILLVANDDERYRFLNVPITKDKVIDKGPLAGIHAGLLTANHDTNLFVACDMPFISSKLAKLLVELSDGFDAVVPVIDGEQHPLFAVYKKSIIRVIENCFETKQLRIKSLLNKVNVKYVTEDQLKNKEIDKLEQVFYNMNHPFEYEKAKIIAKQ